MIIIFKQAKLKTDLVCRTGLKALSFLFEFILTISCQCPHTAWQCRFCCNCCLISECTYPSTSCPQDSLLILYLLGLYYKHLKIYTNTKFTWWKSGLCGSLVILTGRCGKVQWSNYFPLTTENVASQIHWGLISPSFVAVLLWHLDHFTDITRLQQLIVESKTTMNIKHGLSNVVLLTDYLCMPFSLSPLDNVRQTALYNKMNFTSIYFAFKLFYSVLKNTYRLPLKRQQNSSWIS